MNAMVGRLRRSRCACDRRAPTPHAARGEVDDGDGDRVGTAFQVQM